MSEPEGVDWHFVARDLAHAQALLEESKTEIEHELTWSERPLERAETVCDERPDKGQPHRMPLAQCAIGDWFCSEW